ncbi:MAG: magnesium-translocating P-type ATPase [Oscillospiraceae bacterium]
MNKNRKMTNQKALQERKHKEEVNARLLYASKTDADALLRSLNSSHTGVNADKVEDIREEYGDNTLSHGKKKTFLKRLSGAFIDPFTLVLILLAAVSLVTDVIMAAPGEKNPLTVIIILAMVAVSGTLRLVQETRSGKAADKLVEMIETTTNVERQGTGPEEIPLDEVVVGDIVRLAAGDIIPADMRVLSCKDLFISQSALMGESEHMEKTGEALPGDDFGSITDRNNLAFMGSHVISGAGIGVVVATGDDTMLGAVAKTVTAPAEKTSFEKGVNAVSWTLIRFMLVMVPVVFFINGFTDGDWLSAFLFAISVAVGLTPEMLPMIVTTCLAKGAVAMSKKKTIIKNLNSIQNFGAMDVLCTDKTGTLTQDKIILEYHLDVLGNEDARVLRHAFLNSYFQTGLKNLLDIAIIGATNDEAEAAGWGDLSTTYHKVDEVPFDFVRRRMSVVVEDEAGKRQMITKGAVEEMLDVCNWVDYQGTVQPLSEEARAEFLEKVNDLNEDGMRVIAVAQKTNPSPVGAFSVADESDMVLMGCLAFLDPPKPSTEKAISALHDYGVEVKILTGDNEKVTASVCRQVGLNADTILLGDDVERMNDEELAKTVESVNIFAKLSPDQKSRIVQTLRKNNHTVGYMGDGINDAAAMKVADVGISVDTAVDIAKESADVILLEKDLMVLEEGIIEGRKTYANMIKYIKMTASSNFGNVFAILFAAIFLPFLPMAAIHLLLLNLIYDISCIAIPWDNVDDEFIRKPRQWNASGIGSFMLWIGPTSSLFDITTYLLMYFVIAPVMCGGLQYHQIADPSMRAYFIAVFQAGWFVESMWTQSLVIHMIRTRKIPFIQSHASFPVTTLGLTGILVATIIPFTPFGTMIGLAALPLQFFGWLALTVLCYMLLVTVVKKLYIRRYGELL